MTTLTRDIRQALRLLAGNRGFSVAVLATIALGVGGTAAVFSVIYESLFRAIRDDGVSTVGACRE